ncbi:MAG: hypothetical protein ACRC62_10360 [Microcoleus sp.]
MKCYVSDWLAVDTEYINLSIALLQKRAIVLLSDSKVQQPSFFDIECSKARNFQSNPVFVATKFIGHLLAIYWLRGPSMASLVGATPPGLKELGGTLGRLMLEFGAAVPPVFVSLGAALLLGVPAGATPGLTLLGVPAGAVPGLTLLGVPEGAVPGLALLGVPVGAAPGLPTPGVPGLAVPAGVVIGVPVASLVTALGFGAAWLFGAGALVGLPVGGGGGAFLGSGGSALVPHKLTKSKVVPLGVLI